MATTNVSDFANVLKTLYSDEAIEDLVLPKSPFLGMLRKWEKFDGNSFREVVSYGDILGTSNTFSTAQSNAGGTKEVYFDITRTKCYGICRIGGELIEASRNKGKASFMSALQRQMDSALSKLARKISHQIYHNQYGAIGQISSVADDGSNAVVTLTGDSAAVINMLDVGEKVVFSATDGGSLRSSTAATITAITRGESTSTFTVSRTIVATDSVAADDYIYKEGDQTGSSELSISGLDAWLPDTAPSSTSFFGCDRSVDTRLGGVRYDGSSKNVKEALTRGVNFCNSQGGKISHVFMSHLDYQSLVDLLGTNVQYVTESAFKNPQIGFDGIKLMTNKGLVSIFPDEYCPGGVAYGLQLNTWTLRSLNKAPHILDLDNQNLLRLGSEDSYEIRWGSYHNLSCSAPGFNVRIAL